MQSSVKQAIHVLLADDHPIVRFGFIALLKSLDSRFVFHEADCHKEAIEIASQREPQIALIDLSLSGALSLELIKRLRQIAPAMSILVVSMHDEKLYAERALRAGARGYVMKQIAAKSIAQAVQALRDGKVWLSEELRGDLINRIADSGSTDKRSDFHALSDREVAVFRLIGKGLKKGDIARELNLSPNTVETYRSNIKQKMRIATGAELYRVAFLHSQDESGFSRENVGI